MTSGPAADIQDFKAGFNAEPAEVYGDH
jgi:hypothetical protein